MTRRRRRLALASALCAALSPLAGACASASTDATHSVERARVELRGGDTDTVWNYAPRARIEPPDRALFACCPRDGGDMRIDGVVDGQGRVRDIAITRPPGTLGVVTGAVCAAFEGFAAVTALDAEYTSQADDREMLEACAEGKRRFGGSFVPPAIPGTTLTCVERMASAWTLRDIAARPMSIDWKCTAP